jgi:hypothetical protein
VQRFVEGCEHGDFCDQGFQGSMGFEGFFIWRRDAEAQRKSWGFFAFFAPLR